MLYAVFIQHINKLHSQKQLEQLQKYGNVFNSAHLEPAECF